MANARAHLGHTHVLIEDIESCFPSVRPQVVRQSLVRLGFDAECAGLLMRLCTAFGALPQGAPTSSRLLDFVLAPIDNCVAQVAAGAGFTYSRYVDDITISGDRPVGMLRERLTSELKAVGLRLKRDKSRYFCDGRHPTVTGILLGGDLRPERVFLQQLSRELRHAAKGASCLSVDQLRGRVAWVKQLNPSMGRSFEQYLTRAARWTTETRPVHAGLRVATTRRHGNQSILGSTHCPRSTKAAAPLRSIDAGLVGDPEPAASRRAISTAPHL